MIQFGDFFSLIFQDCSFIIYFLDFLIFLLKFSLRVWSCKSSGLSFFFWYVFSSHIYCCVILMAGYSFVTNACLLLSGFVRIGFLFLWHCF